MRQNRTDKGGTIEAENKMIEAAKLNEEELCKKYATTENGLTTEEVKEHRERYGSNEIAKKKKDSAPKRLFLSFATPFTGVLFILAGISLVTDIIMQAPGERNYTTVIMVTAMVLISGLMTFIQEFKSERATEKLLPLVCNTASVMRDGVQVECAFDDLVVGDRIFLSSGDMIPADVRLLRVKDLFINQSALTGESEPVEKFVEPDEEQNKDSVKNADCKKTIIERRNLAFMGSNVISGSAQAMIICTGKQTMFGNIAEDLTGKKGSTSFDAGINKVSWMLIKFILIMAPAVFLMNGFFKSGEDRWMNALLFALTVAVGLTPEMLPMIVSANLAKSATVMSHKKVIIKNLGAIQNLGAMDVLCTDKTGTLTEDHIELEYHCNIMGEEDKRVLKHAFLNSYFQTGLKNLMDLAIIQHADEDEVKPLCKNYKKVDEIPFDFNRRRMSVVVEDHTGKRQLITKGAVEEMLSICTFAEYEGEVRPMTEDLRSIIRRNANEYNHKGFRVLGIAHKRPTFSGDTVLQEEENDMVFIGYLAFLDPPKKSAKEAISKLHDYGVSVKILTGDNDTVSRHICGVVGIETEHILLGSEIEDMTDEELAVRAEKINVFAKLSPSQKTRIVSALRKSHTVGFMGDGINDASAMKHADVGISVDTAVDIAKESADIILTEKDLNVLENGIIEGRRTYANTIKYIKITTSSNFGNMLSILAASIFLPFLPMIPVQLLILNLIYDISCLALPFDNVDTEYLKTPRKWDANSIGRFMLRIGPVSSLFDISTYLVMFFLFCPAAFHNSYQALDTAGKLSFAALFQAGWFVESQWTQTVVIHSLRTPKIPILQSHASIPVYVLTFSGIILSTMLAIFVGFGAGPQKLNFPFFIYLIVVIILYSILVALAKKSFVKKYGELL